VGELRACDFLVVSPVTRLRVYDFSGFDGAGFTIPSANGAATRIFQLVRLCQLMSASCCSTITGSTTVRNVRPEVVVPGVVCVWCVGALLNYLGQRGRSIFVPSGSLQWTGVVAPHIVSQLAHLLDDFHGGMALRRAWLRATYSASWSAQLISVCGTSRIGQQGG
jgi:hypothetical protein